MATAFSPGLRIDARTLIRKTRRLPVKGEVVVAQGDHVEADTVVARVEIPGTMSVVKAAMGLGCPAERLRDYCLVEEGQEVDRNEVVAERPFLFGWLTHRAQSAIPGTVEYISKLSGNIGVRGQPVPITCSAYLAGKVAEILPEEGVIVETVGALVQGIFGVGGERHGTLQWINVEDDCLDASNLGPEHRGRIVLFPGRVASSALTAAAEHGVVGIIGASMIDSDLMGYLGFDIGVAITGEEDIPFTLVLTEGFGSMTMPRRTRDLLQSLDGEGAAINGATQIRAGVIRPELIVPREGAAPSTGHDATQLAKNARVRLIRRPHFGRIGHIESLPEEAVVIPSGAHVRVLSVRLDDGDLVTVPRSNVEILAASGAIE